MPSPEAVSSSRTGCCRSRVRARCRRRGSRPGRRRPPAHRARRGFVGHRAAAAAPGPSRTSGVLRAARARRHRPRRPGEPLPIASSSRVRVVAQLQAASARVAHLDGPAPSSFAVRRRRAAAEHLHRFGVGEHGPAIARSAPQSGTASTSRSAPASTSCRPVATPASNRRAPWCPRRTGQLPATARPDGFQPTST